ncbi:MAG TPA: hypothetical protein VFB12_05150, partial [Ktedonobacteraceae bacterium]|nr:hypothetical protein [Ktedonobacteraceae bacterium]
RVTKLVPCVKVHTSSAPCFFDTGTVLVLAIFRKRDCLFGSAVSLNKNEQDQKESGNAMGQGGKDEQVRCILSSLEQEESQNECEGRYVDEEFLRGVIHDVASSLTVIRLNAELLERDARRKAALLAPEQLAEQRIDREQGRLGEIIRHVHQVEKMLGTMAEASGLRKNMTARNS